MPTAPANIRGRIKKNRKAARANEAAFIDKQVGEAIRRRRTALGLKQDQIALALEISYQQIQKYEAGTNRVSAGRLAQIAHELSVPVGYFFDGLALREHQSITLEQTGGPNHLHPSSPPLEQWLDVIGKLKNPEIAFALFTLAKVLSQ
ncbi:helix-turn-helix domain-containing protein [Candidatus Phycosocius spiralis]|uniref:HTH cro/C1-type domain-containing protein n=1 Tax=Candidatus Phycosocius spiralis TaxID=2815099 RepID=A0ABQ4PX31_9PROT|nr:helix-turn-helix transcriptional regulator [Candidatus Phycosocius spiralis]GIU67555.1 hypothetical protein PsB1_1709 [Candidatus Phycosocius spiralis]